MQNPLKAMWDNLRQRGAMIRTAPEAISADVPRPELHCCCYCGAGISRLSLKYGGILGRKGQARVKAQVFCRNCKRQHTLQGNSPYERGVVLILLDQPRRTYRRATIFRNGNVR